MKLKKILVAHQKFSNAHSLSDNLGDGYLMDHNPVFLNVRLAALKAKLKFSPTRFFDYEVLPLTQLPKILAKKTIPYVDNVNALKEIESAMPGVFQLAEVPPLRANYVLHEAAHGLARKLRVSHVGDLKTGEKSLDAQRELALAIMFEESFANAAESLLSVFAMTEIHNEFLSKNTYIFESVPVRQRLKRAIKMIGLDGAFRLVLLSYLYSNFLRTTISAREFDRVLTVVLLNIPKKRFNLKKNEVHQLREVFLGGFDLDPVFTIRTNGFCLRLMGIKANLHQLFAFDFLAVFENDSRYQHCMNAMTQVICGK